MPASAPTQKSCFCSCKLELLRWLLRWLTQDHAAALGPFRAQPSRGSDFAFRPDGAVALGKLSPGGAAALLLYPPPATSLKKSVRRSMTRSNCRVTLFWPA